jgi:hypothetical protein
VRDRRRFPGWVPVALLVVLGGLIFLPALRAPLFLDDYFQTSMIEGTYPVARSPFDLYNFVGDADRAILLDRGLLPWWSHPQLTVRFLRPLSSALLYAEHRVLGLQPFLFHLHSFAWWLLAALGARALFQHTLGRRAGLFATFIFAFAACHALPLVWLANREVLVSLGFGILGLNALVRFFDEARPLPVLAATALFALSLLGGEYAVGLGGYVLAMALADRRPSRAVRLVGLLSFAVPAAVYLSVRAKLGYGAEGSGFYHDPFHHLLPFLERVPRRLGTLLAQGWFSLDPETIDPELPGWILASILLVGGALLAFPLKRALASLDATRRGHAHWLLLGSVLSLAPVLAVMPGPRVLGASMLGVAGTVALILERAWFPPTPEPRVGVSEIGSLIAVILGFAHLVHGPGLGWMMCRQARIEGLAFVEHAAALRERVADPSRAEVILVRGIGGSIFVLPYALDRRGTPPARWRILSLTGHVLVLRHDARSIDVSVPKGLGLFPNGEGNLFRGEGVPLAAGDVVTVPGMRVTVLEVGAAGPRRARFELDAPLESPSFIWVHDRIDGIRDATPPQIGFGKPFDAWPPLEELRGKPHE